MSQGVFNQIIPTSTSGSQLATILNDFKDAVISGFSGTTRPTEIDPGGYWIDTTLAGSNIWQFKIWTGTLDIEVFRLNLATGTPSIVGSNNSFEISRYTADAVGPILSLLKERIANNGQVLTDDIVGLIEFKGGASDNTNPIVANIRVVALDDYTNTENGAYIAFEAANINSTAVVEMMRIINGRVGIGTNNPASTLHVRGESLVDQVSDSSAVFAKQILKKSRVAGNGQTLNGEDTGMVEVVGVDQNGAEVPLAQIVGMPTENTTDVAQGSQVVIRVKDIGDTAFVDKLIVRDVVELNANLVGLEAQFSKVTTTELVAGTTTEIEDPQIILNNGGNQATAQAAKAGFRVEMSDSTDFIVGFDNTKASEFVAGRAGSEKEIVNVDAPQTLSAKTLQDLTLGQQNVASAASIIALSTSRSVVNITGVTATSIEGIDSTGASKTILIHNRTNTTVTLVHQAVSALAANRLLLPEATDIVLLANSSVELFYNADDSRWKLKSGSGSGGGGALVLGAQTIAPAADISLDTVDQRQLIRVASNGGVVNLNSSPFGSAGGWKDGTEVVLVGTSDSDSLVLSASDTAKGVVGNFSSIEITRFKVVTMVWDATLDRFVLTGGF